MASHGDRAARPEPCAAQPRDFERVHRERIRPGHHPRGSDHEFQAPARGAGRGGGPRFRRG